MISCPGTVLAVPATADCGGEFAIRLEYVLGSCMGWCWCMLQLRSRPPACTVVAHGVQRLDLDYFFHITIVCIVITV